MPKVRSPYAEPVVVPWLDYRTVNPNQVVGVTDAQLPGFLASGWQPADADAKKAAVKLGFLPTGGVVSGQTYVVGESGPENVVLDGGTVVPTQEG